MAGTKADTVQDDDAILAQADKIRSDRAAAAQAELVAKFAPLIAFQESDAFKGVLETASALAPTLVDQAAAYSTLTSLSRVMEAIGLVIPAAARQPAG
jgi:hypothetical protein